MKEYKEEFSPEREELENKYFEKSEDEEWLWTLSIIGNSDISYSEEESPAWKIWNEYFYPEDWYDIEKMVWLLSPEL